MKINQDKFRADSFLRVFVDELLGSVSLAIVFFFINFHKLYFSISELIDLSRWIRFNPWFIPWTVLIVL